MYFQMRSFADAQKLVLTLRRLRGDAIPPRPAANSSLEEALRWLLFLYCPRRVDEAGRLAKEKKEEWREWLLAEFGVTEKCFHAFSEKRLKSQECEVLTDEGVVSVKHYLRPATPGSTVFSNSSAAIVYQLQTLLPREEYNRLAQVASIHYPSPMPIIRAVVTAQNKDWGALFDQDSTGFVSCLKRSTLFMRRSFRYRSFHIWSLC